VPSYEVNLFSFMEETESRTEQEAYLVVELFTKSKPSSNREGGRRTWKKMMFGSELRTKVNRPSIGRGTPLEEEYGG